MANTNPKVMSMVERTLKRKPGATVDELYEKAKGIDASIAELTHRQFHARYPLQVKRRKGREAAAEKPAKKSRSGGKKTSGRKTSGRKAASGGTTGGSGKKRSTRRRRAAVAAPAAAPAQAASGAPNRDVVREQFLRFAAELAAAEDRKSVVRVLSGVERYVDRVMAG